MHYFFFSMNWYLFFCLLWISALHIENIFFQNDLFFMHWTELMKYIFPLLITEMVGWYTFLYTLCWSLNLMADIFPQLITETDGWLFPSADNWTWWLIYSLCWSQKLMADHIPTADKWSWWLIYSLCWSLKWLADVFPQLMLIYSLS